MPHEPVQRRLAAIMFADIVGYTALMAESEERGRRARERHRAVARPLVHRYGGQWIEERGDESLSAFPNALDAVNCALALQEVLRDEPDLTLRIGIHLGDVVFEGDHVYGDGVNVAARIRPLAEPGGVCVSDEVQHSVQNQPNLEIQSLGPRSLKNVPRPVGVFAIRGAPGPPSPLARARGRPAPLHALAAALALLVAGLGVWLLSRSAPEAASIRSIAVLPFADMSPARDQEYFADGVTEELIGTLSKIADFRVVARTSTFAFKGENLDVREIGEQLNVGAVVEGSVRRAGDDLRITAQLVQVADGFHLWAESYDRKLEHVFEVQEEIASAVAQALQVHLAPTPTSPASPERLRAFDLYVTGRHFWSQRTGVGLRRAADYFEKALEHDPEYAPAWVGLADVHLQTWLYSQQRTERVLEEAERALARALELDDTLAEAHATRGLLANTRWDWEAAEEAFRRSIELKPGYASAHQWHGQLLLTLGRSEDGMTELYRAHKLDPLSPVINGALAGAHLLVETDYARAIDLFARAVDLAPNYTIARLGLAYAYARAGRESEAVDALLGSGVPPSHAATLRETWRHHGMKAFLHEWVAVAEAASGRPCEPTEWNAAAVFAYTGDEERALECLELGYGARRFDVAPMFKLSPIWDPLRDDPRFAAILQGMGLDDRGL